jgi:hypothetical protein
MGIIQDITFIEDDDGNDTGEWVTLEDEMGQNILDEDMGVHLDLGNLALLELGYDDRVLHIADDASATSFRSALGAGHVNGNQTESAILGANHATGASEALRGADSV